MNYTLGIGIVLEGEAFNTVRSLELTAATANGNFAGLGQPPHITIKRPFEVAYLDDVKKVQSIVEKIALQTPAFNVEFSGLGSFGDTTLFLTVNVEPQLQKIHEAILAELRGAGGDIQSIHEGPDMIFHTSIATNLQAGQLSAAQDSCSKVYPELRMKHTVRTLGLFLGLDHNSHWSVLFQKNLA